MAHRRNATGLPRLLLLAVLATGAPAAGQGVTARSVDSAAAVADQLRPPGSDRYAPAVDFSRLPPWRQTRFFDVRAQGTFFVYVVDCSGSMDDGGRLNRAKAELRRCLRELQFPQRYLVVFYNDRSWPMPGGVPLSADIKAKNATNRWLSLIEAEGDTDPRAAMKLALALKPDAVFLLSDGAFPDGAADTVISANARKTPVHCIDLSGGAGGDDLKRIADASGGQYAARPTGDH